MRELCLRLENGADIKRSIEQLCIENGVDTAVVLSGVGCVKEINIRLAKAVGFYLRQEDYEIVSLNGTVSKGKAHIHIALADEQGRVIGGHLCDGCIVNTTCELVLGVLEEYSSKRIYDGATAYDEIVFRRK